MREVSRSMLVVFAALAECAAAQFYEAEPRPPSEVSTFSSSAGSADARIVAIDGRTLHGNEATVLPGEHTVLLHLTGDDLMGYELDSFCSARLDTLSFPWFSALPGSSPAQSSFTITMSAAEKPPRPVTPFLRSACEGIELPMSANLSGNGRRHLFQDRGPLAVIQRVGGGLP